MVTVSALTGFGDMTQTDKGTNSDGEMGKTTREIAIRGRVNSSSSSSIP